MAAMILVNDPGDWTATYGPLLHSKWNGWTPTDLVFPFFLFIVGVAMAFSFSSRLERGGSHWQLFLHAAWRGVLLFALGMLINGFPNHYRLETWRVYGVLQRIAICYVGAAILELWFSWRSQLLIVCACLVGYWILMRFVPVPGFGVPNHGIPLLDPDRNWVAWLDRKILSGHLYEGTRDPEGLLSTVPALATCLAGVLTGKWLRSRRDEVEKLRGMLAVGISATLAGEIFNIWFPINKKLWTSSYVVFTAGLALILFAVSYWIIDMKGRKTWSKVFLIFGTNSIAAYVFSELLASTLDYIKVRTSSGDFVSPRFLIWILLRPDPELEGGFLSLCASICVLLLGGYLDTLSQADIPEVVTTRLPLMEMPRIGTYPSISTTN